MSGAEAQLLAWLVTWARDLLAAEAELTDLDAAIGDGDHGANMARGAARLLGLDLGQGPAGLTRAAGMALISSVGGASGPLYGTFFLRFSASLQPAPAAGAAGPTTGVPGAGVAGTGDDVPLEAATFAAAFTAGAAGVAQRGKSGAGDKTMLDVLLPAAAALSDAGPSVLLPQRLDAARQAAASGLEATIAMVARKGRASYLGERSAGHQDPGATSSFLLVRAAAVSLGAGA